MTKHEFEDLVGKGIPDYQWETINLVYTFYPIEEVQLKDFNITNEKELYAVLFKSFGYRIFEDMYERATQVLKIDSEIKRLQKKLYEL